MKNLFIAAALVLALSANAAVKTNNTQVLKEVNQEKEYKKIEASALPSPVSKELKEKYAGYTVTEAHAASDGSDYKVVLSKDTNAVTVWYTAAGEFVKEEKKS